MADSDKDNGEEEKSSGGGKKNLMIGLVLGLVLGGGGGFGAFMMMGGDEKVEEVPEEVIVVEEKPKIDPQFVKIARVSIPLIRWDRVLGYVVVDFSLKVDGNDNKMVVFNHLPEIRDAILRHYSAYPIGKPESPKRIDFPRLKKTLQEICNDILHDPLVLDVLITEARQY